MIRSTQNEADGGGGLLPGRPGRRARLFSLWAVFLAQAFSALVFVGVFWSEVLGLRRFEIDWAYVEVAQVLASIGLLLGMVTSALLLRQSIRDRNALRRQVEIASGKFSSHIQQVFANWELSRAEIDVAIYAVKGFSNAEISELRATSVATVKSQMTAIFRKSGLTTRQQLVSHLIEDLLSGIAVETPTERLADVA